MKPINLNSPLCKLGNRIDTVLHVIYGNETRCRGGNRFIYIWWGSTVMSTRYKKKEAEAVLKYLTPMYEYLKGMN